MRPHTGDPPAVGCVQRSGTRAVMRSFLLPDFHPETMINYFWCSGSLVRTPLPFGSDGNLFPRFLGKEEGGGGERTASQPLSDEFNSNDRSISRIFRDPCRGTVVEFSWRKKGGGRNGSERNDRGNCWSVYYFVWRTIKFLGGVSISVPSIFTLYFPFPRQEKILFLIKNWV